MKLALLIDFGSTYTKIAAVDLASKRLIAVSRALSTADSNLMQGLESALNRLPIGRQFWETAEAHYKLACSSAKGGLRLIAIGLVPELTLQAAKAAALGAGAKLVGSYAFKLTKEDVGEIEEKSVDLLLLVGGTDGGDSETITHNARLIADSKVKCPIIVAGNRIANEEVRSLLESKRKQVVMTANVFPALGQLNIEPTRRAIREMFMKTIVHAKGLDKAHSFVHDIIMPTPMAVLKAACLLAYGTKDEPGLGELMVVDVGGATTDVHSVASGSPTVPSAIVKGLPEPFEKRTVEGDLGIRHNAVTILDVAGEEGVRQNVASVAVSPANDLKEKVQYLSRNTGYVAASDESFSIDVALARTAVKLAVERHVGVLQEIPAWEGIVHVQKGKDLSNLKTVIGTGGVFLYPESYARQILEASVGHADPFVLAPRNPDFYIDETYILYAIGLLSEIAPTDALQIAKSHLKRLVT